MRRIISTFIITHTRKNSSGYKRGAGTHDHGNNDDDDDDDERGKLMINRENMMLLLFWLNE